MLVPAHQHAHLVFYWSNDMAALTAAEMVTEIDEAIAIIVASPAAQSQAAGKTWTLQNLTELRDLRRYYAGLAARESGAGGGGFELADLA